MTKFKELLKGDSHLQRMESPSASASTPSTGHTLYLRFGPKEVIDSASYHGPKNIWLASLCELLIGKTLFQATQLQRKDWELAFEQDLSFWDLWSQETDKIFFLPLELLKAALDRYQGREWGYQEASPLVCRCFGVREEDIIQYLNTEANPTPEGLGVKTKASMGCRSCLPQIERWFKGTATKKRFYKERSYADWLILIDEKLCQFPEARPWDMEVESFKGNMVIISHQFEASQRQVEEVGQRLQDFLGSLDPDLGFLLRRARQR